MIDFEAAVEIAGPLAHVRELNATTVVVTSNTYAGERGAWRRFAEAGYIVRQRAGQGFTASK